MFLAIIASDMWSLGVLAFMLLRYLGVLAFNFEGTHNLNNMPYHIGVLGRYLYRVYSKVPKVCKVGTWVHAKWCTCT